MKTTKALFGILSIIMALAVQVQAQSFLTNGLVAYYRFNGNANDASGNANNGTVYGATLTTNRFGEANQAYYFNGVNSEILVPETLFGPTDEAWSVSIWVTTGNGPFSVTQNIFGKSSVNGEMDLCIESGLIWFGPKLAASGWLQASTPVRSNSVMHIVGVYQKGQSSSLYIDGVLMDSVPEPNENLNLASWFPLKSALGSYHYTPGPYMWFRGTLDDFRVYKRALSASEVQQLYAYESGPRVDLIKAVKPSFGNLTLTTNYQLQVSGNLNNWTNQGTPFTATNTSMVYPQYWDVDNWNELFFRLQATP